MVDKRSLVRHTAYYSLANYGAQGLGMINSILLRRFLGPVSMGVWSLMQVVLGYCGYASFGTTKAMGRDYPFLKAKGEVARADTLKDTVITFSMLMSIIPALALSGYLVIKWNSTNLFLRHGLLFIVGFLFLQRFYDVVVVLLRSDKKFNILSYVIFINASVTLIFTLTLVKWWNIYGLLIGTTLALFLSIGFIYWKNPYPYHFRWNAIELWAELKLGVPLIASSLLFEILRSLDKWIIARNFGLHDLGLYSIATMAAGYATSAPMMFSHVWYPHLQEIYGRTEKVEEVGLFLIKPIRILSVLCPFLAGMGIFLVPLIVDVFMPKFTGGILAMKFYLLSTVFLMFAQLSSNFLTTVDKYLWTIPILILSVLGTLGVAVWMIALGYGLPGVAFAALIGFFLYGVCSYGLSLKQFLSNQETARELLRVVAIPVILFFLIGLIDKFTSNDSLAITALIKTFLFIVASLPFFYWLNQDTGFVGLLTKAFLPKKANP